MGTITTPRMIPQADLDDDDDNLLDDLDDLRDDDEDCEDDEDVVEVLEAAEPVRTLVGNAPPARKSTCCQETPGGACQCRQPSDPLLAQLLEVEGEAQALDEEINSLKGTLRDLKEQQRDCVDRLRSLIRSTITATKNDAKRPLLAMLDESVAPDEPTDADEEAEAETEPEVDEDNLPVSGTEAEDENAADLYAARLEEPIEILGLSKPACRILRDAGLTTVGELDQFAFSNQQKSPTEVTWPDGIREKDQEQIYGKLSDYLDGEI